MKNKNRNWVKKHHLFTFKIARLLVWVVGKIQFRFHTQKYKMKKGEQLFIVSNHQTLLDPFLLNLSFNKPIYFVASDNLFSNGFASKVLHTFFAPIPKKKSSVDPLCIKTMMRVAKEGGSVGIFPEGNRSYCDEQFPIEKGIAKLVKALKLPLCIYHFEGGYGVNPRWGNKVRKGYFEGKIIKIYSAEEIKNMSDDTLYDLIISSIQVQDRLLKQTYDSPKKGEYLERVLFYCPKCHKVETLLSKGNEISCTHCQLKVTYENNLTFKCEDSSFPFTLLSEWYEWQKCYFKEYKIQQDIPIFQDANCELFETKVYQKRKKISKGNVILSSSTLQIGNYCIDIQDIISIAPTGGTKLLFSTKEKNYLLKGHTRFNPLKYLYMISYVLPGYLKDHGGDFYFPLDK